MIPILKLSAVLILTLVPLSAASAQGQGQGGGQGMMQGQGMMGPGRFLPDPATLPALKEKLAVTAAQEPQWKAYVEAASKIWETRQAMRQSMQGQSMTMAERQETRAAHQEAGAEIHADLQKTRDALSAILTPEQRLILDQQAPSLPVVK